MDTIVEDAKKDAKLSKVVVKCTIEIKRMSYYDFVRSMEAEALGADDA